jgi:hypothetical protein
MSFVNVNVHYLNKVVRTQYPVDTGEKRRVSEADRGTCGTNGREEERV